jgi:hypothetical protein
MQRAPEARRHTWPPRKRTDRRQPRRRRPIPRRLQPAPRRREGTRRERGAVTAEAAVALFGILFLTYALTGLVGAYTSVLRCQDAAREAARAAARGEPPGAVLAIAQRAAPRGSTVDVAGAEEVTVTVRATAGWPGGFARIPVVGAATSLAEPSG